MQLYPKPNEDHEMTDLEDIKAFIMAGKATFTLVSRKTGKHYTFHAYPFQGHHGDTLYGVTCLSGADGNNYLYIGTLFSDRYKPSNKHFGVDAPSQRAASWFFKAVFEDGYVPSSVSFQHAGVCGKCARELTNPESLRIGLGADCAKQVGIALRHALVGQAQY